MKNRAREDREARRVSRILAIKPIGTCGILIQTFRQASITEGEALQILDDLVKVGLRISSAVYRRILDDLGARDDFVSSIDLKPLRNPTS
jgi:predicted nucleic acid-binding protein